MPKPPSKTSKKRPKRNASRLVSRRPQKGRRSARNRTITLYPITYNKASLAAVPEIERTLHFMMAQTCNDITALNKQLLFSLNEQQGESDIERFARTSTALLVARLLAGRTYESWNLIQHKNHSNLLPHYKPKIPPEALSALVEIKKYFGKGSNLIGRLRHKVAFHTDFDTMKQAYIEYPDSEVFRDFISEGHGNSFYEGAAYLQASAMKVISGCVDIRDAINTIAVEILRVSNWIITYANGFLVAFVSLHVRPQWKDIKALAIVMKNAPNLLNVRTPYFCEAPPDTGREL